MEREAEEMDEDDGDAEGLGDKGRDRSRGRGRWESERVGGGERDEEGCYLCIEEAIEVVGVDLLHKVRHEPDSPRKDSLRVALPSVVLNAKGIGGNDLEGRVACHAIVVAQLLVGVAVDSSHL